MKAAKQIATRQANAKKLKKRLSGRMGPLERPHLPAVDFQIDLSAAAAAMLMSEEEWLEQLCDGRKASGPAESWAAQCVGGKTCANKNEKGYDVDHPRLGRVSVKCLTRSKVCFEMSVDVGAGRGGVSLTEEEKALPDAERLGLVRAKKRERSIRSISQASWHAVVDIRKAPNMRVILLPAGWLLAHCKAGTLDSTGWTGERFYDLLEEAYDLRPMSLGRRMPNSEEREEIVQELMGEKLESVAPVISKADRLALLRSERDAMRQEERSLRKKGAPGQALALVPAHEQEQEQEPVSNEAVSLSAQPPGPTGAGGGDADAGESGEPGNGVQSISLQAEKSGRRGASR